MKLRIGNESALPLLCLATSGLLVGSGRLWHRGWSSFAGHIQSMDGSVSRSFNGMIAHFIITRTVSIYTVTVSQFGVGILAQTNLINVATIYFVEYGEDDCGLEIPWDGQR